MEFTSPRAYLLGATKTEEEGLAAFLRDIGAEDWTTDAEGESSKLAEVAGRLCYRSFAPGLNPNVSRVREGNAPYIGNILDHGHGSVLEHGSASFAFMGVSRVFTHELVRHRIAGYSQESLRFIRLDKLTAYFPEIGFGQATIRALWDSLDEDSKSRARASCFISDDLSDGAAGDVWAGMTSSSLRNAFRRSFETAERDQRNIAKSLFLDRCKNFEIKKKITSAMRRLAPDGLGTAIVMTANHRVWRDTIQRRTSRHAEEEIRLVFAKVFEILQARDPAIYQDAEIGVVDGMAEVVFRNPRV